MGLSSLLVAVLATAPQDLAAEFDAPMLARGTVLGADGLPVAGARARLVPYRRELRFRAFTETEFDRLPPIVIDADGDFVLALTEQQRRILGAHCGGLRLVVDAPGRHAWNEPLERGLLGYLGSDVVLEPIRPAERTTATLPAELRDGLVLIERRLGSGDVSYRTEPIPADGRITLVSETVPVPPRGEPNWAVVSFATVARILAPGRSTEPAAVVGGTPWRPGPTVGERRTIALRSGDGRPLQNVRGAYRCPDAVIRWFAIADPVRTRADAALELVAVVADGMRAAAVDGGTETLELESLAPPRDVTVRISDPDGDPVPGCVARLEPLATDGTRRRPSRSIRAGPDGTLRLAPSRLFGPARLHVRAPGFAAASIVDPRARVDAADPRLTLEPVACGALRVSVTTVDRQPIRGAHVLPPDEALAARPWPTAPFRTGADGDLSLPHLVPGGHRIWIDAPGSMGRWETVTIEAGETAELNVVLSAATALRIVTADEDGHRLPFAPLTVVGPDDRSTVARARSDSRGRLLANVDAESPRLGIRLPDMGRLQIDDLSTVQEVILDPPVRAQIRAPIDSWRSRIVTIRDGGGASSSGAEAPPPARERTGRFLLSSFRRDVTVRLGLGSGPPVRVRVGSLEPDDDGDILIDRREIVRRVPLVVRGPAAESLHELRAQPVSPHYSGNMYSNGIGDMLEVAGDEVAFVARDRGAWSCRVLHPDFLARELDVSAASGDGQEKPLSIELERATRVIVRFVLPADPPDVLRLWVRVRERPKNGIRMYVQDLLALPAGAAGGDAVEYTLPSGLEAGAFTLEFDGPELDSGSREIDVTADSPLVIDLTR